MLVKCVFYQQGYTFCVSPFQCLLPMYLSFPVAVDDQALVQDIKPML